MRKWYFFVVLGVLNLYCYLGVASDFKGLETGIYRASGRLDVWVSEDHYYGPLFSMNYVKRFPASGDHSLAKVQEKLLNHLKKHFEEYLTQEELKPIYEGVMAKEYDNCFRYRKKLESRKENGLAEDVIGRGCRYYALLKSAFYFIKFKNKTFSTLYVDSRLIRDLNTTLISNLKSCLKDNVNFNLENIDNFKRYDFSSLEKIQSHSAFDHQFSRCSMRATCLSKKGFAEKSYRDSEIILEKYSKYTYVEEFDEKYHTCISVREINWNEEDLRKKVTENRTNHRLLLGQSQRVEKVGRSLVDNEYVPCIKEFNSKGNNFCNDYARNLDNTPIFFEWLDLKVTFKWLDIVTEELKDDRKITVVAAIKRNIKQSFDRCYDPVKSRYKDNSFSKHAVTSEFKKRYLEEELSCIKEELLNLELQLPNAKYLTQIKRYPFFMKDGEIIPELNNYIENSMSSCFRKGFENYTELHHVLDNFDKVRLTCTLDAVREMIPRYMKRVVGEMLDPYIEEAPFKEAIVEQLLMNLKRALQKVKDISEFKDIVEKFRVDSRARVAHFNFDMRLELYYETLKPEFASTRRVIEQKIVELLGTKKGETRLASIKRAMELAYEEGGDERLRIVTNNMLRNSALIVAPYFIDDRIKAISSNDEKFIADNKQKMIHDIESCLKAYRPDNFDITFDQMVWNCKKDTIGKIVYNYGKKRIEKTVSMYYPINSLEGLEILNAVSRIDRFSQPLGNLELCIRDAKSDPNMMVDQFEEEAKACVGIEQIDVSYNIKRTMIEQYFPVMQHASIRRAIAATNYIYQIIYIHLFGENAKTAGEAYKKTRSYPELMRALDHRESKPDREGHSRRGISYLMGSSIRRYRGRSSILSYLDEENHPEYQYKKWDIYNLRVLRKSIAKSGYFSYENVQKVLDRQYKELKQLVMGGFKEYVVTRVPNSGENFVDEIMLRRVLKVLHREKLIDEKEKNDSEKIINALNDKSSGVDIEKALIDVLSVIITRSKLPMSTRKAALRKFDEMKSSGMYRRKEIALEKVLELIIFSGKISERGQKDLRKIINLINETNRDVLRAVIDVELLDLLTKVSFESEPYTLIDLSSGKKIENHTDIEKINFKMLSNIVKTIGGYLAKGFVFDADQMKTKLVILRNEAKEFIKAILEMNEPIQISKFAEFYRMSEERKKEEKNGEVKEYVLMAYIEETAEHIVMATIAEQVYKQFNESIRFMKIKDEREFKSKIPIDYYTKRPRPWTKEQRKEWKSLQKKYRDLRNLSYHMTRSYDFRRIFNATTEESRKCMDYIKANYLAPIILGKEPKYDDIKMIRKMLGNIIIKDSAYGGFVEQFTKSAAQHKLNIIDYNRWTITRWLFDDDKDFDWDTLAKTKSGRKAIDYYGHNILLPRLLGRYISSRVMEERLEKFEDLLDDARGENEE